MASTVLPNGIIIPEKYSRDWYNDLYHNWQELDNLLGGGTPKDGTLTIQKNGDTVGTFSANQATNETVNITVPTATSELTNDSNFVESSDLATVATSGSYTDLSDKPTIPTVNDATLTIQKNGTDVATFSANSSTNATANITVPTKTSDLTNDSGFITEDTTKIPLAGSNQISGSLIPATTDAYDLGGASYQWNNAYIKSLTINGVSCGDILTHNVSEFVNVTGAQTIGGAKTFYTSAMAYPILKLRTAFIEQGLYDSNTLRGVAFRCVDKNDAILGDFGYKTERTGEVGSYFSARTKANNTQTTREVKLRFKPGSTDCELVPDTTNAIDLGTSTNKWKSFNGINPGVLSLPGNYINVDTTNWVLDGSNANIFTPASDGWLGIQVTDTVYDQMHYVFVGRNDSASYHSQNVLSPINALWDGEYHGCVFIPVIKNVGYDIRCICSTIVATFYPCQGNV